MQSFTLDLKTLLQILSRQKQNGLLQAEISSDKLRFSGTRQTLQANILLDSGIIRDCTIALAQGGRVAEGQEALQLLLGVGVIEWHWKTIVQPLSNSSAEEVSVQPILPTNHSLFSITSVPRRTSRGEEVLQTLPREYRKILALVDGQRSVHKLAAVLAIRDEEVMTILRTLQNWGLVS